MGNSIYCEDCKNKTTCSQAEGRVIGCGRYIDEKMEQKLLENALSICRKAKICVSAKNYEGISYATMIEQLSDDIQERNGIEIIIKCIEKQIPKQPILVNDSKYFEDRKYICPTCENSAKCDTGDWCLDYVLGFCEHCGQKFDLRGV